MQKLRFVNLKNVDNKRNLSNWKNSFQKIQQNWSKLHLLNQYRIGVGEKAVFLHFITISTINNVDLKT